MSDLFLNEAAGHDAHNSAASCEARIGEHSHQADGGSSIDQRDVAMREERPNCMGRVAVGGVAAHARAAENAEGTKHPLIVTGGIPLNSARTADIVKRLLRPCAECL